MLRLAAAALASVLVAAAGVALYARTEVVDSDAFAARVAAALDEPPVRTALAERLVAALSDRVRTDALVVRPLAVAGVAALAGTPPVRRAVEQAVRRRHAALLHDDDHRLRLALRPDDPLLAALLEAISRRVVERLPVDVRIPFAVLRPHSAERTAADVADRAGAAAWWLAAAALIALAVAAGLAGSLRAAVFRLGVALAGAGLLCAALVALGGQWLASRTPSLDPDAVGALWDALLGDLRDAGLVVAAGGTVLAALAGGGLAAARAAAILRAQWARWAPRPVTRAAASVLLLLAGVTLLLAPGAGLRLLAAAAGAAMALVGLGRLAGELSPVTGTGSPGRLAIAVGAAAALTVVAVAILLPGPSSAPRAAAGPPACQGARANCALPLDAVLFPGTHNSYAAADERGWYFANQRRGIARQLRDGIRALLLDVHYGVRDPRSGRVRTDLAGEGSTRNKVARALSPEALRLADGLAGRVGRAVPQRERKLYLCHTLCELGAEPLDEQLQAIRAFLASDPDDVLLLVVEPYVPPEAITDALAHAGLDGVATLRPGAPLPTLGELVGAGPAAGRPRGAGRRRAAVVPRRVRVPPGHAAGRDDGGRAALRPLPRRGRRAAAHAQPLDPAVPAGGPRQRAHRRRRAGRADRGLRARAGTAGQRRRGGLLRAQRGGRHRPSCHRGAGAGRVSHLSDRGSVKATLRGETGVDPDRGASCPRPSSRSSPSPTTPSRCGS